MGAATNSDLRRFMDLYASYSSAHVRFRPTADASAGEKIRGRYETVSGPAIEETWRAHLEGTVGLGIILPQGCAVRQLVDPYRNPT